VTASTFRIPAHVRAVIDDDGAVLLDIRKGTYFSLNPMAVEIWRHLEAGRSVPEMEGRLQDTFDAPAAVLREDLGRFLAQLRDSQLIDGD
jgi:hypothetical protein